MIFFGKPVPTPHQVRGRLFPDHALGSCFDALSLREPAASSLENALSPGDRIERRKPEIVRAGAGVKSFLREDVLPGRVDIAQAPLQR